MKGLFWLAGGAAAFAAVVVLARGPADDAPPPVAPVAKAAQPATADGPTVQHAAVAIEAPKPPPAEPDPAARKGPRLPEPLPAWIDAASFVAAGLTKEQADTLVAGLVKLHERKARVPEHLANHRNTSKHLDHLNLLVMELGPRLAAGLAAGSIPRTWGPVPADWPSQQVNGFTVGDNGERIDRIDYAIAGKRGVLHLDIPAAACDRELLAQLRTAMQAPPVGSKRRQRVDEDG